jgi:MFS family permease
MSTWLKGIGRAVLMALTWAVLWAPFGVAAGMLLDPTGTMDEPWPALGAYPGFLCGVVFSIVLALAARHRRLAELSCSQAAIWGTVSGLVVIAPLFTGLLGTPNTEHALWQWRYAILGAVVLLSSISAFGSVLIARMVDKRALRSGTTNRA